MSSSLNWESGGTSTREKLVALARRMLNRSVLASRYFHVTAAILGRFRDRARLPARYTSRMSPARRSLGAGLHGPRLYDLFPSESRLAAVRFTLSPNTLPFCLHKASYQIKMVTIYCSTYSTRCLFACTTDADSSMRKGLYAETPSVSHNDRDWLDVSRCL